MAVLSASCFQAACSSQGNSLLRKDLFSRERMSGEASCSSSVDMWTSTSCRSWHSAKKQSTEYIFSGFQPAASQMPLSPNVKPAAPKPSKNRQSVIRKYATGDDVSDPDTRLPGDLLRQRALVASAVAPLNGAYVTEAEVGLVECGPRGCRPVYDTSECLPLSDDWMGQDMGCRAEWDAEDAADLETRMDAYHRRDVERRLQRGLGSQQFESEFAQFLDEVWMERDAAEKYYETALLRNPCDPRLLASYAQFTWRTMGNPVRAEGLYKQALAESPDSAEVLAAYALFLWQSEAEGLGS